MLSLKEALEKPVDTNVNIRIMALRRISSEAKRYQIKVLIADESASTTLTSYNQKIEAKLIGTTGLTICNAINKGNGIVATSRTLVGITNAFVIPEEVRSTLEGETLSIRTALGSPSGKLCSIRGKISEIITPPRKRMCHGVSRDFAEVTLQDPTGTATVAMWGNCTSNLRPAQIVHMTNIRVKLFDEQKKLSTTPTTLKEEIEDAVLRDLPTPEEDGRAVALPQQGEIIGVMDVDPYYACHLASCKDCMLETKQETTTKLKLYCPTHMDFVPTEAANFGLLASLLLTVTEKTIILKAKLGIIQQLLEHSLTHSFDRDEVSDELLELVGKKFKYSSFKGVITAILK